MAVTTEFLGPLALAVAGGPALTALVLLGERLSPVEVAAMVCVVGASRWG